MIEVANDNNLVSAREFWNAKVEQILLKFDYGRISLEQLVDELCHMGYEREQVWALISEDEDY